jgi:hypothetical protein
VKKYLLLIFFGIFLGMAFSGCESLNSLSLERLKTQTSSSILDFAEPAAIDILKGIQTNDFQTFRKDFNDSLNASYTEEKFTEVRNKIFIEMGDLKEITFQQISTKGDLVEVIYLCNYQKGSITLNLDLEPFSPFLVSDFSFPDFK